MHIAKLIKFISALFFISLPAIAQASESDDLNKLLTEAYEQRVHEDPMLATKLGRKQGLDSWPDLSEKSYQSLLERVRSNLKRLHQDIDFEMLDADSKLNYQAFEADLELRLNRNKWRYHLNPINQIVGLHLQVVGVLVNYHQITDVSSAQAYIARMQKVGTPIEQLIDLLDRRHDKGFTLPKSLFPRLIQAAESVTARSDSENVLLKDFNRKLHSVNIPTTEKEALQQEAQAALDNEFIPAYKNLIAALKQQQEEVKVSAGVWQMPQGDDFYQFLLEQYTTTDITADEVHSYGLSEVKRIHTQMDEIRREVGFEGDLDAFLDHMKTDASFYFNSDEAGREQYLALANSIVDGALNTLDQVIPIALPEPLQIKRIEAYREKSAPVGFYESGSAALNKPGTIFLGMYDMSGAATYDLYALLYHEGVPGHHLQSAVMQTEPSIPPIRQYYIWWQNTAYTEGWALYAESLADEMGLYPDAYAQFGRLAGELWRACRLVVDSGLNAKHWSRQQAIEYLNDNTASSLENNERAVDRYLAVPGQATAFKIGMRKLIELRESARARLGDSFDSRQFHYLVLRSGPLPLTLLEQQVNAWVDGQIIAKN